MPRSVLSLALLCSSALFAVACGGPAETEGSTTEALTSACPAQPPADGDACSSPGLQCTFGSDPRVGCRPDATCLDRKWQVLEATCPKKIADCPALVPTASNGDVLKCTKAQLGLTCIYGQSAYTCTPCTGTLCYTESTWSVSVLAQGCPGAVPNLGDACSTKALYCDYNVCADDQIPPNQWATGVGMKCINHIWQYSDGGFVCL